MNIGTRIIKLNARGESGKATMPIDKACREMGPERESATRSLDRSRSQYNVYHFPAGVTTGQQLSDRYVARVAEANAHIKARRAKGETEFADGKQLISNCVAGPRAVNPAIQVTITPDGDSMARLTRGEQIEVLMATKEAFEEYFHVTLDAWAIHFDESVPHMHGECPPTPGDPDHYSNRTLTARKSLLGWHRAFDGLVTAHLDPAIVAKAGGIAHHRDADERAAARARGEVVLPAGLPANDYAELRESQRNLEDRRQAADEYVARARQAVAEARADAARIRAEADKAAKATRESAELDAARTIEEADGIELEAHYVAAGEQEAARQLSDSLDDRLDAVSEIEAESQLAASRAQAELAAATRRREEEESRAREAEAAKAKADRELARAQASVRHQRDLARWLGPEGSGVVHDRGTPDERVEPSVRTVREQRRAEESKLEDARAKTTQALDDAERARSEAATAQECLDGINADFEDRQRDLGKLEDEIATRRDDLEVATRRGPISLSDVVSKVIGVCARALDAVAPRAADWLRGKVGELRERAIDAIAPETKRRELADYDGPKDEDEQDEYERED